MATEFESVMVKLSSIEERLSAIEKGMRTSRPAHRADGNASEGAVADDRDLDGQHGDPVIKFDPREKYWPGPSYAGRRYSECPPDYLLAMAKYQDACAYMKRQDGNDDKAKYNERDAARARGWALRNQNGEPGGQAHTPQRQRPANRPAPAAYGGGSGYGAPGAAAEFGIPGGSAQGDDIPFMSSAFDPHHVRRS